MKLEKAIEIVEREVEEHRVVSFEDYDEACRILIEAGKRCEESKHYSYFHPYRLLPGETEE